MDAFHDVAHAKDVIARNSNVPLSVILKHPDKNWTAEAKAFLQSPEPKTEPKQEPQTSEATPPNGYSTQKEVEVAEAGLEWPGVLHTSEELRQTEVPLHELDPEEFKLDLFN